MDSSGSAVAGAWAAFGVAIALTVGFSIVYVGYYRDKRRSHRLPTAVAAAGISTALLTAILIPVDIFLVSFMKDANGTFKEWSDTPEKRESIKNGVLYAYYALYSLVLLFVFVLLPMTYFCYREVRHEEIKWLTRLCRAFKYSLAFVLVASTLFLLGAYVPLRTVPAANISDPFILNEVVGTRGEDALSFVVSTVMLIGLLCLTTYTAYGMSSLPVRMLRGSGGITDASDELTIRQHDNQSRIESIQSSVPEGQGLRGKERRAVDELSERQALLDARGEEVGAWKRGWRRVLRLIWRPAEVFLGLILFILSAVISLSLLLTNVDKAMHSLGPYNGYLLLNRSLLNPLDATLGWLQKGFPADYILMSWIVVYLVMCSVSAIQQTGIWFSCIRGYRVLPRRTTAGGLLMECLLLIHIVLAISILLYDIAPQYVMFGSQHYITQGNALAEPCVVEAVSSGDCLITRVTMFITRFYYKAWFFGACYYWISWCFLLVYIIGFVLALALRQRSAIMAAVDEEIADLS